MTAPEHLRGVAALRPFRGRQMVVVVCFDEPSAYESRERELEEMGAKLVVEREHGELSDRLARPSVTVCDRYLDVVFSGEQPEPDEVVSTVRWLELGCEECTPASVDTPPVAAGEESR
ncbi:MAG TPA: hypothetical protein VGV40_03950 [Solirubrobacteraceae bacterium]|nr:hypothetical protein [Solirubrobacteraceae bacterium]